MMEREPTSLKVDFWEKQHVISAFQELLEKG